MSAATAVVATPPEDRKTPKQRGAFIVLEGLDRSGKTTQCEKLVKLLGDNAVAMKFPDRTTRIGKVINEFLTDSKMKIPDKAMHLLFCANRWERAGDIEAALTAGKHVICDRYSMSGIAYGEAKMKNQWPIIATVAAEEGLPMPDRYIFIDVDPKITAKRGGYGSEKYEQSDFQLSVKIAFDALVKYNTTVVDGNQSIDDLHKSIINVVVDVIGAVKHSAINYK